MSVVVDPNAPDTFKERAGKAYKTYNVLALNIAFVGMLVAVAYGAPEWFANITHTLVWLYVPLLILCVVIFFVITVVMSMNKEAMIANKDDKARELSKSMSNMAKTLKPKPVLGTINHVLTVAEVVLLYMVGWTVAGAFVLILSLMFLLFKRTLRKQVADLAMAKLGRE
jgi:beta-lactamase regulating signal transducer with metallopeptidase domain